MHPSRCAGRRPEQAGFTLIEVVVSLALLGLMAGVIAAAFGISFKVIAPGHAKDQLAGAHDQERFEQNLGQDVGRAACVEVAGGTAYGSCGQGFATVGAACTSSATILCIGWANIGEQSCHIARFASSGSVTTSGGFATSTGLVRRREYKVPLGGSASVLGEAGLTTDDVTVSIAVPATSGSASVLGTPSGESYAWLLSLSAAIRSNGSAVAPTQQLVAHPAATDPHGAASEIALIGTTAVPLC